MASWVSERNGSGGPNMTPVWRPTRRAASITPSRSWTLAAPGSQSSRNRSSRVVKVIPIRAGRPVNTSRSLSTRALLVSTCAWKPRSNKSSQHRRVSRHWASTGCQPSQALLTKTVPEILAVCWPRQNPVLFPV